MCYVLCLSHVPQLDSPNSMYLVRITKEGLKNMQKERGTPSTPFHNMEFCSNRQRSYSTDQFIASC